MIASVDNRRVKIKGMKENIAIMEIRLGEQQKAQEAKKERDSKLEEIAQLESLLAMVVNLETEANGVISMGK